jgi:lipopolysaccharide/colanic/teichoic acid biosynthesis glycosyltransferase
MRQSEWFDSAEGSAITRIGLGNDRQWLSYAFQKHAIDYGIGILMLLPATILLLAVAVAIKLDSPGPIFFCQTRRGLDNQLFTVVKFRSMYAHLSDINVERQTSRGDPRVTRVGKWLRRHSLDELPQLWNVLRGEMSLVGPRPHAPNMRVEGELLSAVNDDYLLRYRVKPGITGWAQVNGVRGEVAKREDLGKRIDYDLDYIRRWSFGFDLRILILTMIREIFSKNAF